MQCFQLPKGTTNFLDKYNSDFFCKKSNIEKGLPMVALDACYRLKRAEGLGLRRIEATNKAFQCKLAWKSLRRSPGLWIQSMNKKYLQNSNFLTHKQNSTDS